MISLNFACSDPTELATRLVALGLAKADAQSKLGLAGVLEGVEIVEIPNPVIVTPAVLDKNGNVTTPAVMDGRHVYMVKLVRSALGDQIAGKSQVDGTGKPQPLDTSTKLGAYLKANGTPDTFGSFQAWNLGGKFWLVLGDLGMWQ